MKAVVFNGPRDVSVDDVPDVKIEKATDVLVRITSTNICGSDLHMYEGRTDVKAYNRRLCNLIAAGRVSPSLIVSHELPLARAPDAYKHFDAREKGWTKVVLKPAA